MTNAVVDAILGSTADSKTQLAMLLGSNLESGWSTTAYNPNDPGGSAGPFQINLSSHPGVTIQQAEDPKFAASYMEPTYAMAVSEVPQSLWTADPEKAAEETAFLAERPAKDYYASHGDTAVQQAFIQSEQAQANPGSTVISGTTTATETGFGSTVKGLLTWPVELAKLLAHLIDPAFWLRIGEGVLGAALIVGGIMILNEKTIEAIGGDLGKAAVL